MGSKKYFPGTKTRKVKTGHKRKYEKESCVSSKSKKIKKIRQKFHKSSSHLNEYVQQETSSTDLGTPCQQIPRTPSSNSIIYVKTYPQKDNIPLIDLTKSSHNILYNTISSKFPSTSSLKLIYKSNNFKNGVDKHLATSLVTVPLRRTPGQVRNVNSSSNITRRSRDKLSILDIPPEFFDCDTDDSEYAFCSLSKANLNEEAKSTTEHDVVMKENENESFYNLESKASTQNMCQLYEVFSKDNFQ